MARSSAPEKRPGFFRQIRTLYTFTQQVYRWLPFLLIGLVLLGIGLGVTVGLLLPPVVIWTIMLWSLTGLMLGVLSAMMVMTRLSTKAMYKKIDGTPGAVGHIMSQSLGRKWQAEAMPVGINPKTQDAVYRAIGRGGIVLVGEGAPGRLTRLIGEERIKVQRVAAGVPIHVIHVGHDKDSVPLDRLAPKIRALPNAIDRATMAAVIRRVDSVSQSIASLPIPKGIDPAKARAQRPR